METRGKQVPSFVKMIQDGEPPPEGKENESSRKSRNPNKSLYGWREGFECEVKLQARGNIEECRTSTTPKSIPKTSLGN